MKKKFNIIMPVYNTEKYLSKSIESVLNQTITDFDLYCINDASTDRSLKALEKFAQQDNRIKIINFEENKGSGFARNYCMQFIDSEYLCFVDSDDYVSNDFLETFDNGFITYNTDSVWIKAILIDDKGKETNKPFWGYFDNMKTGLIDITPTYLPIMPLSIWNKAYKTELVKSNNVRFEENCGFDDSRFYLEYFLNAPKGVLIDKVTYNYRQVQNSNIHKSTKKLKNFSDILQIIYSMIDIVKSKNLDPNYYNALYLLAFSYANVKLPYPMNKVLINKFNEFSLKFEEEVPNVAEKSFYLANEIHTTFNLKSHVPLHRITVR